MNRQFMVRNHSESQPLRVGVLAVIRNVVMVSRNLLTLVTLMLVPCLLVGSALGADFKKGDKVFVITDGTDFKLGDATLRKLAKGTELTVAEVQGDWVGGNVRVDGKMLNGWVRRSKLSATMPRVAADDASKVERATTEKPVAEPAGKDVPKAVDAKAKADEQPKATTNTDNTLAAKFEKMMAQGDVVAKQATPASGKKVKTQPAKAGDQGIAADAKRPRQPLPIKQVTKPAKATKASTVALRQDSGSKKESATVQAPKATNPAADKPAPPKKVAKEETTPAADKPAPKADDVGEGPEALAKKFEEILAKRRGKKPTGDAAKKPEPKKVVARPTPKPKAVADSSPPPTDDPIAIGVLVLRIPDDLEDVDPDKRIGQMVLSGDEFTNRSLRALAGLSVDSLRIEAVNVSNTAAQYISKVRGVRTLRLWTPGIDDSSLKSLAQMKYLELLDIEGTSIDGSGLGALKDLQHLSILVLGPRVTDTTLAGVQPLSSLQQLDLRACEKLTLECIESIAKLKDLEVVWLPRHLRTKGKRALKVTLPKCQVRS